MGGGGKLRGDLPAPPPPPPVSSGGQPGCQLRASGSAGRSPGLSKPPPPPPRRVQAASPELCGSGSSGWRSGGGVVVWGKRRGRGQRPGESVVSMVMGAVQEI